MKRPYLRHRILAAVASTVMIVAASGCATPSVRTPDAPVSPAAAIRIGAVFPLRGAGSLAKQELVGVQLAAEFANADGGVRGRRIELDVRDLEPGEDARNVMRDIRAGGATIVIGAYSSDLSIAASTAATDAGLVYWEAGAVADQLTGRGLSTVFRVGASGANLGRNSAEFAADELAPRLDLDASRLRVAIVNAEDDYARSVADAAVAAALARGMLVVSRSGYEPARPDWRSVTGELSRARANVIILASHIPDGIEFRRRMLAAHIRTGALIGSTMAQCDPDFAGELGKDAIGIFASDRPTGGFQPGALGPAARATYDRFATAWAEHYRRSSDDRSYGYADTPKEPGRSGYVISGPGESAADGSLPTEEGLAGFSAAWALFHDVLPNAPGLDAEAVAAAARATDLPMGSLPNGAGLRFSASPATLGQNERAAAAIWQWQAVRTYTFVWPRTYATGKVAFVPLER